MLREYKNALIFVVKYVLLYLMLNTAYAFFIDHYAPSPDPLTTLVTRQSVAILALLDEGVETHLLSNRPFVPITKNGQTVVEVFEGCNSLNVIIVFISFIVAYQGPIRRFLIYLVAGTAFIYLLNLLRVIGLYEVALHFPNSLYFFHKFFFTGILFGFVFLMWYFWIRQSKIKPESP